MYGKIQCPDCESYIHQTVKECSCGWRPHATQKIIEKFCKCGKETGVSNLCWECYEPLRPKNDIELKLEADEKKNRDQAILEGCVTSEDFINHAKRALGISRFGKEVLDRISPLGEPKVQNRMAHLELSPQARKLKDELDEKQK